MSSEYNITENDLIGMGFRVGSCYSTYRIDGSSDGTWFYIQTELLGAGGVRAVIYGESPPLAGEWQYLDTRQCSTADEVRELLDEVFSDIYQGNQSLIRPPMPLTYVEIRT